MAEREEPVRLAIFISGRGSNMKTLVQACLDEGFAKPVLILSVSITILLLTPFQPLRGEFLFYSEVCTPWALTH